MRIVFLSFKGAILRKSYHNFVVGTNTALIYKVNITCADLFERRDIMKNQEIIWEADGTSVIFSKDLGYGSAFALSVLETVRLLGGSVQILDRANLRATLEAMGLRVSHSSYENKVWGLVEVLKVSQ